MKKRDKRILCKSVLRSCFFESREAEESDNLELCSFPYMVKIVGRAGTIYEAY